MRVCTKKLLALLQKFIRHFPLKCARDPITSRNAAATKSPIGLPPRGGDIVEQCFRVDVIASHPFTN